MEKNREETKEVKVNSAGREDEFEKESPAGDFGVFLNYNVHPIYSHLL